MRCASAGVCSCRGLLVAVGVITGAYHGTAGGFSVRGVCFLPELVDPDARSILVSPACAMVAVEVGRAEVGE